MEEGGVGYIGGVWAFLKRSASKERWTTVRMSKRTQDAMSAMSDMVALI